MVSPHHGHARLHTVPGLAADVAPYISKYGGNVRQPFAVFRDKSGVYYLDAAGRQGSWQTIGGKRTLVPASGSLRISGSLAEIEAAMRQYLHTVGILAKGIRPFSNDPQVYVDPLDGNRIVGAPVAPAAIGQAFAGVTVDASTSQQARTVLVAPAETGRIAGAIANMDPEQRSQDVIQPNLGGLAPRKTNLGVVLVAVAVLAFFIMRK